MSAETLSPTELPTQPRRSAWRQRLVDAETGFRVGIRADCTLFAFFFLGVIALLFAIVLKLAVLEWAIFVLALGVGLSAELFHQVLKHLAREFEHHLPQGIVQTIRLGTSAVVVAHASCFLVISLILWQRAKDICNF